MYQFIDTNELRGIDTLPSEALKINGQWIEDQIPGYRTLNVSGREMLSNEIADLQVGSADGRRYLHKRYEPRTITVTYQLIASSNSAFRDAYNKLNALLDVEETHLIFKDEEDKYFIGTWSGFSDVMPGVNRVTGEIEFYCADPFKYSVKEFEVSPTLDGGTTFAIDYKGTYKAFPIIEAKMNGDNGFLGFTNTKGSILQFGSPEEADGVDYKQNEMLSGVPGFTDLLNDFGTNYMHPSYSMKGVLITKPINGRACIHLSLNGPIVAGTWNGGMKTLVLPPDSTNIYGAKNFYCYLNHWFETGLMGQTAEQSIAFLTADNKVICGYSILKNDMSGNEATLEMWVNNRVVRTIGFIPSAYDSQNPFNGGRGHNDIRKEGDKVTFYWWGSYPSFIVPEIRDMECHKIQIAFSQYSDRSLGNPYVTCNFLRSIDFQKMQVEKWRDVPNKFMGGDTFTADCRTGEVLHRGLRAMKLGSLGNDWETFALNPGTNQVKCMYSSWGKKPDFKLKYREAYL